MDTPATLQDIQLKLRLILTPLENTTLEYSVNETVPFQFKILGIYSRATDKASFTIDLIPGINKLFVYRDLPFLITKVRQDFEQFSRTTLPYSSPFEYHTTQTIFYNLVQIHFRIVDTILPASTSSVPTQAHIPHPQQFNQPRPPPPSPNLLRPPLFSPRTSFLPQTSHLPINMQRQRPPLLMDTSPTSPPEQDMREIYFCTSPKRKRATTSIKIESDD